MTSLAACTVPPCSPVPTVADLMARMAAGDRTAVFVLAETYGSRVVGVVRRSLRRCGVDRIGRDDLDGLVLDACMALLDVAGGWRPEGAQPWIWAEGRIRGVVATWVGVHADVLDVDDRGVAAPSDSPAVPVPDEDVATTFARLVDEVSVLGLVDEACVRARIPADVLWCLLEYRIQQDQGDPSPAHTLAPRYGISPEAVRQRVSRSRRRLREVATSDPRFATLADLALVA